MKTLILALALLLTANLHAQTNVYSATLTGVPKTKKTGCSTGYYFIAVANYKPTNGTWFYPDTNVTTISFTNPNVLIDAFGQFGDEHCGHGSVTWTNLNYPNEAFLFGVYWSNNVAPPTNQMIPLTTMGFTNVP